MPVKFYIYEPLSTGRTTAPDNHEYQILNYNPLNAKLATFHSIKLYEAVKEIQKLGLNFTTES